VQFTLEKTRASDIDDDMRQSDLWRLIENSGLRVKVTSLLSTVPSRLVRERALLYKFVDLDITQEGVILDD
jgi:hypothetical protein